jgi:hypothetical protein
MCHILKFRGGYLDWESIIEDRNPATIDDIPKPSVLGVKSYNYISYIWVNERSRGKGRARKAIEELLKKTSRSFLIMLYNYKLHNGFVMKKMLRRMGFRVRVCSKWRSDYPREFCYMFLKR